ncbi:MAG: M23 family metallopeptidase [Chloroflexota bacterium]|nr:M23 family metallopeptidase [Chloroflexota bacterium]
MRLVVSVIGGVALAATVSIASTTTALAPDAVPVATPRATPIPGTTGLYDAAVAGGRLADDDRAPTHVRSVHGLLVPLAGASVPEAEELLPNSPRQYRAGSHEGIDFPAGPGTPVLAAATGTIVRIDTDFADWGAPAREAALAGAMHLGYTPSRTLDLIRGRQVWIDHGAGIVTRYAHLSAVAPLALGARVAAGTQVGAVGSSGYPEGGPHLHFEIRVGEDFLGNRLAGPRLARLLATAFRP